MKIRTRLMIISIVFTLLLIVIGLIPIKTFNWLNAEIKENKDANLAIKNVFELNILTYQYLMHNEKRMQEQWKLKYKSFGKLLNIMKKIDLHLDHRNHLDFIKQDYNALGDLFLKLQTNFEKKKILIKQNSPKIKIDMTLMLEKRLIAQMLMRAQKIVSQVFEISDIQQKELSELQQKTYLIILFSILAFILLSLSISFFLVRSITVPVKRLIKGVKIIGAGNLEYTIKTKSNDEIGQLSQAFSEMIKNLQQTTASRNELEKEVNERMRAEISLSRSERFLSDVFNAIQDGISVLDTQLNIVRVNKAMEKMYSNLLPLQGKKCYEAYHGNSKPCKICPSLRALKSGNLERDEIQFVQNKKVVGTLEIYAFPMLDNNGKATGVVEYVKDITTRRNALESKQETSLWLKSMFNALEEAVFLASPDRKLIDVNPAVTKIFGYTKKECHNLSTSILHVDNDHYKEYGKKIADAFDKGKTANFEFTAKRKNGEIFPTEHSVSLLKNEEGKPFGILSVLRDISTRKKYEDQLLFAREMAEKANQAKSDFIANMSHEIRTPMNAIIGMADLLKETHLTHEQKEFVQIFEENSENLLCIINDIIDFSKIEANKLELESVKFNILTLIDKTIRLMAIRAHTKGLEVNLDLDANIPLSLIGDPVRLRQILTNLLSNAIKFTESGEILVKCEVSKDKTPQKLQFQENSIDETSKDKKDIELLFSIADTGIGISDDKKDIIFEKFSQEDTSTTRKYGGTGLGLAISKQLIEAMDDTIWVENNADSGSTFYFTARFGKATLATQAATIDFKPIEGISILIIDDNNTNRLIFRKMLKILDVKISEAEDGPSGLAMLQKAADTNNQYDLVLLDCRMPGMDGFEVAERIQRSKMIKCIPIMMLTSDERRVDPNRYKKLGIRSYLLKPIRWTELLKEIIAINNNEGDQTTTQISKTTTADFSSIKNVHILLAEDYLHNQIIIEKYLKNMPCIIDIAQNGIIAVDKFKSGNYDLVLMDIQMPVMDGLTATKEIRRFEQETVRKPVPIIALTAYALKQDEIKSFDAGCNEHLNKPIKKDRLLKILSKYLAEMPQETHQMAQPTTKQNLGDNITCVDKDFAEFIPIFLEDINKDIQIMKEALKKNDLETIRAKAHSIKGSGGGYGLSVVSDFAKLLESAAKEKNIEEIKKNLSKLYDYIQQVEIKYE